MSAPPVTGGTSAYAGAVTMASGLSAYAGAVTVTRGSA